MPFNTLYNFAQAEQELQYRLGNRTDLGSGSADRLTSWLNSAQYRIAAAVTAAEDLDQTFTFNTVSGQAEYSENNIIPPLTNVIGIKDIRNNTTQVSCRRFPWTEYRSLNQQAVEAPLRWARFGYVLALDPKPGDGGPYEIQIDYRMQPQFGITQVPNWCQEDWITLAEAIGWKALMKPDRAQAAMQSLPPSLALNEAQLLDRDRWESMNDTSQTIAPMGFDYPYTFGVS
jgi:hypothetical protein